MVKYPINTKRDTYRGSNQARKMKAAEFNRVSFEIENYVNGLLQAQTEPIHIYMYYVIASGSGFTERQVRDVCFWIDAGSNGFTAIRSDLDYEQAMELARLRDPNAR